MHLDKVNLKFKSINLSMKKKDYNNLNNSKSVELITMLIFIKHSF